MAKNKTPSLPPPRPLTSPLAGRDGPPSLQLASDLEAAMRRDLADAIAAKKDDTVLRFALEAHTRTVQLLKQQAQNAGS